MRKLIACTLALAAVAGVSLVSIDNVQADEKASAVFEREYRAAKTALDRNEAIKKLPQDLGYLKAYEVALGDPYWTNRAPVIGQLRSLMNDESRPEIAKYITSIKDPNAKHQFIWSMANSSISSADSMKPLFEMLKDPKLPDSNKASILRGLWRWPAQEFPVVNTNDNEEERKKKEEITKKIHEFTQPILRAHFDAYFDFLKWMNEDKDFSKRLKAKKPDTDCRWLMWLTVYGLEKLTSEERGDNISSWGIYRDELDNKKTQIKYRFDEAREVIQIGDVASAGRRTAIRQKPKRLTGSSLLMMPSDNSDLYFAPYDREFTQYFDISSFIRPNGEEFGKPHPEYPTQAYYYPTKKVADSFVEMRKGQGGMVGMLAVNDSAYLAMEYADSDPDGCAFIICIGAWSGPSAMSQGRQKGEQSKDDATKFHYRSLYFPKPREDFDDLKNFHKDTGRYSHRFADTHNPDIYYLIDRIRAAPAERATKQAIVDDTYSFKTKTPINVPVLFIWGDKDEAANQKQAENDLKKYFKNAKFVTMKDVSLTPWLENPIGFFDEFEAFMTEKKVWERIEKFKAAEESEKGKKGKK